MNCSSRNVAVLDREARDHLRHLLPTLEPVLINRYRRRYYRSADTRFRLTLDDDSTLMTRTVVLAVGVQYRKLPLDRLEEFEGAGIYYAATELEARVCGDSPVTAPSAQTNSTCGAW